MNDAAAGCHPLDIAGGNCAAVAKAVGVFDRAGQHIGNRFDAAMRMPREAGQVVLRDVVAKIIQQQERIEIGSISKTERAAKVNARTLAGGFRFYRFFLSGEVTYQ